MSSFFDKLSSLNFFKTISRDNVIGIDLGTVNTIFYIKSQGICLREPSVVALLKEGGNEVPYLYGKKADEMFGKTPINIVVIKPMQDGVIADAGITEKMIEFFIEKVKAKNKFMKPTIVVSVPFGATQVDINTIQHSVEKTGAKDVFLVYEPIAAAIGTGLFINDPVGSIIVDIGGGTTDICVISLGGIVCGTSIKIGGNAMKKDIIEYVKQSNGLLIGDSMAEKIKTTIGSAYLKKNQKNQEMRIIGRDIKSGSPTTFTITTQDVVEALSESVSKIIDAVKVTLEACPPELSVDIVDRGITLAGGGCLLNNLDHVISEATKLPVFTSPRPHDAVIRGIGVICEDYKKHSHVLFRDKY